MNKKKLFCTVIADAILRESQFTRRDLKDIVRIFQYNRVVQDPEDPVFSEEEIKEINQLADQAPTTVAPFYISKERISSPLLNNDFLRYSVSPTLSHSQDPEQHIQIKSNLKKTDSTDTSNTHTTAKVSNITLERSPYIKSSNWQYPENRKWAC